MSPRAHLFQVGAREHLRARETEPLDSNTSAGRSIASHSTVGAACRGITRNSEPVGVGGGAGRAPPKS
jgi:hypothetical protein